MAKPKKFMRKKTGRYRNNASAATRPAAASRRYLPKRGEAPDLWTTVAAAAGGAGSALLSALAVDQGIVSKEVGAVALMGIGGATAYWADGNARIVGNSMASAGAGQLAYAMIDKRKKAKAEAAKPPQTAPGPSAPQLTAGAAPAAAAMPELRKAAFGGGYVVDVFRDAANQLDLLDEDEWRMGTRDAADGADVYDLEDLAEAA